MKSRGEIPPVYVNIAISAISLTPPAAPQSKNVWEYN